MDVEAIRFRRDMTSDADKVVEVLARRMAVPAATAQDAAFRLRRRLLERFPTSQDAEALKLFDLEAAAQAAIVAEVAARKRRAKMTLLAGVPDDECERILAIPGLGKTARRKRVDLVNEFERLKARSMQAKIADELRQKGYRPREIALILGTTKNRLKEIA